MSLSPLADEAQNYLELIDKREELDLQIGASKVRLAELAGTKLEGTKTIECGPFKISTTTVMRRTVIEENLGEALGKLSSDFLDVVRVKHSVNKVRLDELERNDPEGFRQFSRALRVKPGAVQIKVKRIEDDQ